MSVVVRLSEADMARARRVGEKRRRISKASGWKPRYRWGENQDPLETDVMGAAGELAVANALGIEWSESVNTFETIPDVGPYEVRTRGKATSDLLVRPRDKDEVAYILVLGHALPTLTIVGYLLGKEAKRGLWEHTSKDGTLTYFPKQWDLHPFEELLAPKKERYEQGGLV